MTDNKHYVLSYFYGTNKSHRIYSDTIFKTVDAAKKAGLLSAINSQLLALDPVGEVELSRNLIISTGTAKGKQAKAAKLDVQRNFTIGKFTFSSDRQISGKVTGAIHVRSDGSHEGKYFTTPITLDSYDREQSLTLIRNSPGKKIKSLKPFKRYLPSGWQKKPFGNNFISVNSATNTPRSSFKAKTFQGEGNLAQVVQKSRAGVITDDPSSDQIIGYRIETQFDSKSIFNSRKGYKTRDVIADFNGGRAERLIGNTRIEVNPQITGNKQLNFNYVKPSDRAVGEINFLNTNLCSYSNHDVRTVQEIARVIFSQSDLMGL